MTRRPSPPPELPGFVYIEPIGTGGFADVFLYEQQMPRRQVAVKVLLADRITTSAAQEFAEEANVMAMLSTHPAIVTIYQAGVAGDGRPYLVMEYCPRPNLQARARKEPLSVAEALRVGVQVAGAVETAHRAGVLHRDIKPANILVTAYNRPALTDFGIASTTGAVTEAAGMSIPWSPPESFGDPPRSGPSSDVYALGATVYTLLSGRSPFEARGGRNSGADLIERIERQPLPALDRADTPDSLRLVLERAMAKNPADRYPSAVSFARALQKVQIELSHSVTSIDIIDDHPPLEHPDGDGDALTRVREVVSIDPHEPSQTRPSAATEPKRNAAAQAASLLHDPADPADPAAHSLDATLPAARRSSGALPPTAAGPVPASASPAAPGDGHDDQTILRAPRVVSPDAPVPPASGSASTPRDASAPSPATRRRTARWAVLSVTVLVALITGIVLINVLNPAPASEARQTESPTPMPVAHDIVPKVDALVGARDGDTVTFTWQNPDPKPGDMYLWRDADPEKSGTPPTATEEAQATVTSTERVCIEVTLRRSDGRTAGEAQTECVR